MNPTRTTVGAVMEKRPQPHQEPQTHSQLAKAIDKHRHEHNCSHTDHSRSRVKQEAEQQQKQQQQDRWPALHAIRDAKLLTICSGNSKTQEAGGHEKRQRDQHGDDRKRHGAQNGHKHLNSRSSTSTSTASSCSSTSSSSSTSTSSFFFSSYPSSASASKSTLSSSSSSAASSSSTGARTHSQSQARVGRSSARRDTSRDTKRVDLKATKQADKLPDMVLESISNQVLEYTKELGLFDELRMKLLDDIETSKEFQVIKANFHEEVGAFCKHKTTDLASSRSKLREQLNDSCHRGDFKSATRLETNIGQVIHECRHELRQQFDDKRDELQQQIMNRFNWVNQVVVAAVTTPLTNSSSHSSSHSSSSSSSHRKRPPPLAQLDNSSSLLSSSLVAPPRSSPPLPAVAPPRTPDDYPECPPASGTNREPIGTREHTSRRSSKNRPSPRSAVMVASMPTPSPSISPLQTPPTPVKTRIVRRCESPSPPPPARGRRHRDSYGRRSPFVSSRDRRSSVTETAERKDAESGQRRQDQGQRPKQPASWKKRKYQLKKKRRMRARQMEARRLRIDSATATKTATNTTTTTATNCREPVGDIEPRSESGGQSGRVARKESPPPPPPGPEERRPRATNWKRAVDSERKDYSNSSDNINNTNTNNNKRIAIKMNDGVTLVGPKVIHLIRTR